MVFLKAVGASLLLLLVALPATSQAKKMPDGAVAKSALGMHAFYYGVAAETTLSSKTEETINENKTCFYQMKKFNSQLFALYTNNNYFLVSRDQKALLLQSKNQLVARGQWLLKRAKNKTGKRIARSLVSHGYFSTFYLQSYKADFCAIKKRIEELGGYTDSNLSAAYREAVASQPGLAQWLGSVDQKAGALFSSISLGSELLAGLGYSTEKYGIPIPLALPAV